MSVKIEIDFQKYISHLSGLISKFNIGYLLLLSLALHLFVISIPQEGYVFDEAHYVPAALKTLELQPANVEHTPLAKIMIAVSISIFGNYWFSWRFPIVLTSIASLYVFYLLSKHFLTEKYALYATAFLSFDIIFFVHGSIFVLDMPAILFGLLGVLLYFEKEYKLSAVSFGLSFLMKELGLLFLSVVVLYHFLGNLRLKSLRNINNWKTSVVFILVLLLVGGGGLWLYDVVYKPYSGVTVFTNERNNVVIDSNQTPITTETIITNSTSLSLITNPIDHIKFALSYFSGLAPNVVTPESNFRPPWSWIFPVGNILNSPQYLVIAVSTGNTSKIFVNWVSQITPTVEYILVPTLLTLCYRSIKKTKLQNTTGKISLLFLCWILIAYVPWLIEGIFIQRFTFNYYILYTIPILALSIPVFWDTLPLSETTKKEGLFLHLTLTVLIFLYFYPVVLFR